MLKVSVGVIQQESAEPRNELRSAQLVGRTCDLRGCDNWEKLQKCARCKIVVYCSKQCQKADWPNHKAACQHSIAYAPLPDPETGGEPPLRRNLRHWTAHFQNSIIIATIMALDLYGHPKNIDEKGFVIHLLPRPHRDVGARFKLDAAEVVSMSTITEIMSMQEATQARGPNPGPTVLELHKIHRDKLKAETNNQEDFATVLVMAENSGEHAFPGGKAMEIRFKPTQIIKKLVSSPQLRDPTRDWLTSLKIQIDNNYPALGVIKP